MRDTAVERNSDQHWLPPWTRLEHEARYDFAAEFVSGKRVIDCACGTGIGAARFASKGSLEVRAIDSSAEAVDQARNSCDLPNLHVTLGDATRTGLPDGFGDLFISLETIEHLEDDAAFIEEAYRVLKPGATFICSTPNREITNPGTSILDKPWNSFHVREYNLEEFRARVESRFEIQEVHGQNPVSSIHAKFIRGLAKVTGKAWAIRVNKLLKCRWFLLPSPKHHAVRPANAGEEFEFYVLVCRRPAQES